MGESGRQICSTRGRGASSLNCRYLFQKEESKAKATRSIFERSGEGLASCDASTYKFAVRNLFQLNHYRWKPTIAEKAEAFLPLPPLFRHQGSPHTSPAASISFSRPSLQSRNCAYLMANANPIFYCDRRHCILEIQSPM